MLHNANSWVLLYITYVHFSSMYACIYFSVFTSGQFLNSKRQIMALYHEDPRSRLVYVFVIICKPHPMAPVLFAKLPLPSPLPVSGKIILEQLSIQSGTEGKSQRFPMAPCIPRLRSPHSVESRSVVSVTAPRPTWTHRHHLDLVVTVGSVVSSNSLSNSEIEHFSWTYFF